MLALCDLFSSRMICLNNLFDVLGHSFETMWLHLGLSLLSSSATSTHHGAPEDEKNRFGALPGAEGDLMSDMCHPEDFSMSHKQYKKKCSRKGAAPANFHQKGRLGCGHE